MTKKTEAAAATAEAETAPAAPESDAFRIDMNDPSLTDSQAVALNLGLTEDAAKNEEAKA